LCLAAGSAFGQTIAPEFAGCYVYTNLGTPTGVPGYLGGINFDPTDLNYVLIGGEANGPAAALYRIRVDRAPDNHITAFSGTATVYATAPNIDGGLTLGPGNVFFFTTYSNHTLGQLKPGSTTPDKTIALAPFGMIASVGTCQFVPPGFPGEGRLKFISYSASRWYDATISPDGTGTFDLTRNNAVDIQLGGGPEGLVFVGAGNPSFSTPSALVSEWGSGQIAAFEIDANGDAIPSTRRLFMSGLSGAEGGVRDPLTGDFLFSTFGGGNRVVVVSGFNLDCRANLNFDCTVDFFDYLDFVALFAAEDPGADFNGDNSVDFFDYLDFASAFDAGC
jgi:hypothetical protein